MKGHLVEAARQDLVAEYVGQTAVKTSAIIDAGLIGQTYLCYDAAAAPAARSGLPAGMGDVVGALLQFAVDLKQLPRSDRQLEDTQCEGAL